MEHLHVAYTHCLNTLHHKLTGRHPQDVQLEHKGQSNRDRIDPNTWKMLETSFGLTAPEKPAMSTMPACERPQFELFIGLAVVLNAISMAMELDMSKPDGDRLGWAATDISFCSLFAGEIFFRIYCLGLFDFIRQPRYLADVLLVACNVADASIQLSGQSSTGFQSFSALRILRLFKIMKVLRLVSHVKELSLIAIGLASALKSLQWVSLLLGVVIFVMAVMFKILMGQACGAEDIKISFIYHFPDFDPVERCEEFWGSVFRCMYTLYQVTTLESWSEVIVRPIWDARPIYVVFILAFQLVTTFGLLNIIVAAIVDGTMNSIDELVIEHQNRKRLTSHMNALSDIFLEATTEASSEVTSESLVPLLLKPDIRRKLLLLNIEYDDPAQIWRILDSDGNGSCDIVDFTTNFMRMRGVAKAKDLLAIRSQLYRTSDKIEAKIGELKTLVESTSSVASPPTLAIVDAQSTDNFSQGVTLTRFQEEMRGEMGRLSGQFQVQMGSFREQLSKDLNERLSMLESNIFSLASTVKQAPLTGAAAELYSQPSMGCLVPREQGLPSLPSKPCCNVAIGAADRESVPSIPVVSSIPVLSESFRKQDETANGKVGLMLKTEHAALIRHLEVQHKLLLARLQPGLNPNADPSLEDIMASLPEKVVTKPAVFAAEPKALNSGTQRSGPVSVQVATTQTSPEEQVPASQTTGAASPTEAVLAKGEEELVPQNETAELIAQMAVGSQKRNDAGGDGFSQVLKVQKEDRKNKQSWMEGVVHGATFETTFAGLITLNAFVMALEAQYTGFDVGFDLHFPGSTRRATEVWPGAGDMFKTLEVVFGVIFVAELLIKIAVMRAHFVKSGWNWLDSLIVGGWLMDTAFGVSAVLNPMMLRLFRLVKLLRVAKLFKSFKAFDSLSILIGSFKASGPVLFWSVVVLFTVQMASALFLSQALNGFLIEKGVDAKTHLDQLEIFEFFGTFTRAFITTMQLTLGNWVPVCRLLSEKVGEEWNIFVMIYIIFIQFAALRVISAVFIVETQKVASTDEELLILQKERQLCRLNKNFAAVFAEIDETSDGLVDQDEFRNVIHDHRVLTWLAALDLDIEQCEGMFSLLDGGDGKISFQEFVRGVQRLKGGAKSVDLIMLMNRQADLANLVAKLTQMVETHLVNTGSL